MQCNVMSCNAMSCSVMYVCMHVCKSKCMNKYNKEITFINIGITIVGSITLYNCFFRSRSAGASR